MNLSTHEDEFMVMQMSILIHLSQIHQIANKLDLSKLVFIPTDSRTNYFLKKGLFIFTLGQGSVTP